MGDKKEVSNRFIEAYRRLLSDGLVTSKKEFASSVGVSPSMITEISKGRSSVGTSAIQNIVLLYNISGDWLLTGKGPMLKNDAPAGDKKEEKAYTSLVNAKTQQVLHDISSFPLYSIDASAGLNKLFVGDSELLGQISIPNAPRCDGAVYVIGASMYPLINTGDIIAYRQVHNLQSIIYGEIYLLQLENDGDLSIVVKYVKRSEKGDDYIKLVSYNKEHDAKDIPLSWIRAIARVTLTIRKLSIT